MDRLAEHIVAWHNRHPLARRIAVGDVHTVGLVTLPFYRASAQTGGGIVEPVLTEVVNPEDLAAPATATEGPAEGAADAPATPEAAEPPVAPPAAPAAAPAASAPPPKPTPLQRLLALLPQRSSSEWAGFDDPFLPGLSPARVARFALAQGFEQPPAGSEGLPRRDIETEPALAEGGWPYTLYLLSAAIDAGPGRTRVLAGRGNPARIAGRRLLDPRRLAAAGAVGLAVLALLVWLAWPSAKHEGAHGPEQAASAASAASAPAVAASAASAAASAASATEGSAEAAASAASAGAEAASAAASAPASAPDIRPQLVERLSDRPTPPLRRPPLGASAPAEGQAADKAADKSGDKSESKPDNKAAEKSTDKAAAKPGTPATPAAPEPAREGRPGSAAVPPVNSDNRDELRRMAQGAPRSVVALVGPAGSKEDAEAHLKRMRAVLAEVDARPGDLQGDVIKTPAGWRATLWPFDSREQAQLVNAFMVARGLKTRAVNF